MGRRSPWSRFVESAVQGHVSPAARAPSASSARQGLRIRDAPGVQPAGVNAARVKARSLSARVGTKLRGRQRADTPPDAPRRRTDVRLALPAFLVWGATVAGVWLTPAALAGLCCGLVLLAAFLLTRAARGRSLMRGRRSFLMTTAVALVLAATAAAHSAVSSSQRHDGPFAEAVAGGKSVVAILEITGSPRAMAVPGNGGTSARWSVAARTEEVTVNGQIIRTRATVLVMGSNGWGSLVPGQVIRTAGKLKPPDPGQQEAALMSASLPPRTGAEPYADAGPGAGVDDAGGTDDAEAPGWQLVAKDLRGRYVSAASFLAADPAGLMPGMVTGDTSALDEELKAAMMTVGMTHLTAVSGANCSLVLGALLLMARSLRLPRLPAAAVALAGLGLFVLLVGPDASVLRAALMGSIALASLAGGRTGRGLSFLCLAVIGLLQFDPGLGTSFGFLLSVLATLGIIVLGQRMVNLAPATVPRWVAAAFAVPLSAQLLCGPVIVLLQPQFSTYSLLANVMAAPLVAPVTLLGTAAVPLTVLAPWAATALIAVAGTFCGGVAVTARFMAGLPGSSLPWPEGAFGLLTMATFSVLTLATVLLVLRQRAAADLLLALHRRIERVLEKLEHHGWPPRRVALARSVGPAKGGSVAEKNQHRNCEQSPVWQALGRVRQGGSGSV